MQHSPGLQVMRFLQKHKVGWDAILDAICDENVKQSYQLITENPEITPMEFLERMGIEPEFLED